MSQIVSQVQALRFQLVSIIPNTGSGPQTDIKRLLCPKGRENNSAFVLRPSMPFPLTDAEGDTGFFGLIRKMLSSRYQLQRRFIFCIRVELCVGHNLYLRDQYRKGTKQCPWIPLTLPSTAFTSTSVCWMSLLRAGRSRPRCHGSQWTPHSSSARKGLWEESKARCPMNIYTDSSHKSPQKRQFHEETAEALCGCRERYSNEKNTGKIKNDPCKVAVRIWCGCAMKRSLTCDSDWPWSHSNIAERKVGFPSLPFSSKIK